VTLSLRNKSLIVAAVAVALSGVAAVPASAATSSIRFTKIQYDSPGTDTRSVKSLNAEYVRITNTGKTSVNLSKWTLRDAKGHTFTFPSHVVRAGKAVYVHTGKGTNGRPDAAHLYWQSGNYVWNNDKDTATLRSGSGRVYDTCKWTKPQGHTYC
jgi:hypothetical protein